MGYVFLIETSQLISVLCTICLLRMCLLTPALFTALCLCTVSAFISFGELLQQQ